MRLAGEPLDDGEQLERAEGLAQERVGADALAGRSASSTAPESRTTRSSSSPGRPSGAGRARRRSGRAGRCRGRRRPAAGRRRDRGGRRRPGFLELDVHDLERRPQERQETRVVVDEEQSHWRLRLVRANDGIGFLDLPARSEIPRRTLSKGNCRIPRPSCGRGARQRRARGAAGTARTSHR